MGRNNGVSQIQRHPDDVFGPLALKDGGVWKTFTKGIGK
jgi:hypothetical protein